MYPFVRSFDSSILQLFANEAMWQVDLSNVVGYQLQRLSSREEDSRRGVTLSPLPAPL